jgi:nitrogen-specific signal transduction histidine kinase/CheY-like chemotaxis protein
MLLAIVRDISQRKSLEKQLYHAQKMESIGTLAGGVAHDFNNLLTVITGYGYMIKTRLAPDDPQMVMIDQILSSTDRAAQLTRGLLAFSRKQALDPKPVELNDIVNRVEKLLRRLIGADVELITTLAEKPLRLFADEGQLEQVFMNLATNARDAMPEGGSLIITTEEKREEYYSFHGLIKPGNYALIKVSDTGCGMDEQTRAKIFEPFFTTKELGRGTGLGLAIVYGIVKQHNGFINVYSEPGRGTSFIIHLPLISELIAPADAEVEPPPRGGTETILFTEDDAIVRTMTGSFLRDFGYCVIAAVDGEDALEKFAEHEQEIDLLILDVMMPKKNGGEVYKAVKALRPDIDVLFVSGYAADIIRQKGILEEDIQFISKPVSPADLLRKIREILDMKQ